MSFFIGQVKSLSFKGLGVVDHPEGKVFFVRGVWPGDICEFTILIEEKKYGFASLKKLLEPSPDRREPSCKHLGFNKESCGGCPWMIADYSAQLKAKMDILSQYINKSPVLKSKIKLVENIQGSPLELGYRNRAQFKVANNKIGYYSPETHNLIDIPDCIILEPQLRKFLSDSRNKFLKNNESMETEFTKSNQKPLKNKFKNKVKVNKKIDFLDLDVSMSSIKDIKLNQKIDFSQGNTNQNIYMKTWVAEKLEHFSRSEDSFLELFSGSGNFTEVISTFSNSYVYAYEGAQSAIEKLNLKKLSNVSGFVLNLFFKDQLSEISNEALNSENLFLDPPRDGFEHLEYLVSKMKSLKTIYYVSCEPSTFFKDIHKVLDSGWSVDVLQPVDQFPQTPHIELLAILSKDS